MAPEKLIQDLLEIPAESQTIEFELLNGKNTVKKITHPRGYTKGTKYRLPNKSQIDF